MRWKGLFVTALAATVAVGFWSAPASANLDNDEVGAALAMPFFTTGDSITWMTVTNGSSEAQVLEIRLIDGTEGGSWDVESLSCLMTANETVLFEVHIQEGIGSEFVSLGGLQCTGSADATSGGVTGATRAFTSGEQGIAFFSLSGPGNALFGDWAVFDDEADAGFSAGAISFQAGPVANEDDVFVFDGTEYSQFPSTLATNFIYPRTGGASGLVEHGAFILFTLNGLSGVPFVPGGNESVLVKVDFYDQFERSRNANYTFGCFVIVPFDDISPNWTADANPGSYAGHAIMSPRGNSPFHGWIMQDDFAEAWARPLVSNAGNFPTATFNDD